MTPARTSSAPRAHDIGLDVRAPKARCDDRHCPFHGRLPVRGLLLEGTVVSTSMQRTAVVERTLLHYTAKFERFEKRRRRYLAHAPPCLNVQVGHRVRIGEIRPLSKVVSFCIIADLGDAARRVRGEDAKRPSAARAVAAEPEAA